VVKRCLFYPAGPPDISVKKEKEVNILLRIRLICANYAGIVCVMTCLFGNPPSQTKGIAISRKNSTCCMLRSIGGAVRVCVCLKEQFVRT